MPKSFVYLSPPKFYSQIQIHLFRDRLRCSLQNLFKLSQICWSKQCLIETNQNIRNASFICALLSFGIFQANNFISMMSMRYSIVQILSVTITFMLGSIGAAPRPPHPHLSRFDTLICTQRANSSLLFSFSFFVTDSRRFKLKPTKICQNLLKLAEELAETTPIRSDYVRIRRGRRKVCYQKICEKKKKWRRRRKICYQMICEEKKKNRKEDVETFK